MSAALAKVLRGDRSGASSALIPAICRHGLQEGVAPLLPGSSPAYRAAGMGRFMHMGLWRNSLPQQKALPFGRRGVLSQEEREWLINQRTVCNLPRVHDGIKGLKHKYMRVPRYEVRGSEFSMLHVWDQMDSAGKVINSYRRSWAYPLVIALLVVFNAACVLNGYVAHKRNKKLLADIRANHEKAATAVKDTEGILHDIERQISHEEAICKEGKQT